MENPLPNIDFSGLDPWGNNRREGPNAPLFGVEPSPEARIIARPWLEVSEAFDLMDVPSLEEEKRILSLIKKLKI